MGRVKLEEIKRNEFKTRPKFDKSDVKMTLDKVVRIVDNMLLKFHDDNFPRACSKDYVYGSVGNLKWDCSNNESIWTNSFWSGILWLMYEYTQDEKYKLEAQKHSDSFRQRIENHYHKNEDEAGLKHHDIGFLYSISTVADYKITGSKKALETSLMAAKLLSKRYIDKAKILQAWGDMNDEKQRGRMIIDCNLNIPLLYFADAFTKDHQYFMMAYNHAKTASKYIIRADASTFHTFHMDVITGEPKYGSTHQGYSDDSCWARGQAWGILGFPISYRYTKDVEFLNQAKCLANYFLNRLPNDLVCNWDLIFTEDDGQRDTSAAAIAAIGLFELSKNLPKEDLDKEIYLNASLAITKALAEKYLGDNLEGILKSGVYFFHGNLGVDEYLIFGDYFFVELLLRLYKDDWNPYW
ncbi:MAG: glycoside hydrolase family 88 protein [Roseburia sp.]|nr:glycoside hydrolase family 88 protein [Anaeroplasma bactoclasticum]MCM1195601.1 glycoside hydrolase family 88 protein [Roseburia sp.]MCM1556191.1 glycoside hydrolase family 88 protein [Anaeroplasma bactoclasticum]